MTQPVRWFVGIDWACESHHVCLMDDQSGTTTERSFAHNGAGLNDLCAWLESITGATPEAIHVAIEVPRGPVVEALLARGFNVYAVNPKQLDRFRDRFFLAGAKDDSRDAHVLCDALRTDRHRLRPLAPADPLIVELREWSRIAEDVQSERNRLANRLRDQLWRYFPQMLQLGDDITAEWVLDLWKRVPTPAKARRLRKTTIAKILERHRIRRLDADQVRTILKQPALTVAPGTTEAAVAHLNTIITRLRLINRQLKEAHRQLDRLCDRLAAAGHNGEQHDVTILKSLPGVGRIVAATLLAEANDALQARDYHALRCLTGVAPVTRRSGKSCIVVRRHACHKRLRNALYHWARVAIQHDRLSRAKYQALRARGHRHARALRGVADRLLAVACAMLKDGTLFDPNHASPKSQT